MNEIQTRFLKKKDRWGAPWVMACVARQHMASSRHPKDRASGHVMSMSSTISPSTIPITRPMSSSRDSRNVGTGDVITWLVRGWVCACVKVTKMVGKWWIHFLIVRGTCGFFGWKTFWRKGLFYRNRRIDRNMKYKKCCGFCVSLKKMHVLNNYYNDCSKCYMIHQHMVERKNIQMIV